MKKIIITGATSFIGVHLIEEWLKEKDVEIFAVVRPNSSNMYRIPLNNRIHILEIYMEKYMILLDKIDSADIFYHLAWEGAREPYRSDAVVQNKNYECAVEAMNVAIKLDCKVFVGTGSQAEYGKMDGPVDETYPCNPITEYGKAKLKTCQVLSNLADKNNMRFIWTRIFSIYGKYDYSGTLVMSCIDKMRRNESMQMTACTQLWDYMYVSDAARALVGLACNKKAKGIYNIASGNIRPLKYFVEEIKSILNSKSIIDYGAISYGAAGLVNLQPDVKKFQNELDYIPKYEFREGIRELLKNISQDDNSSHM